MVTRSELRMEAYRYILQVLKSVPAVADNRNWIQFIPLEELRLIKEGIADPSPALVALLKDLLQGTINDDILNTYLVKPFENYHLE
jgi:hypothetical protein